MVNSEKNICLSVAALLAEYGVREAVISPGSRNAPLIMALNRQPQLRCRPVVDERSAAFIALGMAAVSARPVALLCTSGTALLNYAPAVAEAFYRKLPLIVVSADRPAAWIGQNDSQTLRQPGALANIVLAECDVTDVADGRYAAEEAWRAWRQLNDVLTAATPGRRGPIHINVQLHDPLTAEREYGELPVCHKIGLLAPPWVLATEQAKAIATELAHKRVLIVAGFNPPDALLNRAFALLASLPNVCVIAEGLANIHARRIHSTPDTLLCHDFTLTEALCPDVVIDFGGSLVSRNLKRFLRTLHDVEFWHVGLEDCAVDCFRSLTRRIEIPPEGFFPRLSRALAHCVSKFNVDRTFAREWASQFDAARERYRQRLQGSPWGDRLAIHHIIDSLPAKCNLQLGNGTLIRYALHEDLSRLHRVDCNRGVSGIDGSVSTAIGAAALYAEPTVLIVGEMSLRYDIGALSYLTLAPQLRIIVMNNGGGNIFRRIDTTKNLPELEEFLTCPAHLNLREIAGAFGAEYLCASNPAELLSGVKRMFSSDPTSKILEVFSQKA